MNLINPNPRILKLDVAGVPHSWLTIEEAISYYAQNKVLFELGNRLVTYHSGRNKNTNEITTFTANSIIGVKGCVLKDAALKDSLKLTNEALFERDKYLCAYCGDVYHSGYLSREHIHPVCQDGENIWMNVVTACKTCNEKKGGRTLEQSNMNLLYLPYVPCRHESFILSQGSRRILTDQMEFLLHKIPKTSRFKE